jgi:hypothetical protein
MTVMPPQNRPDMRLDLTRWNRAGLTRFDYVDGDAAVWLEELRLALLGLYMRGGNPSQRIPEYWRDRFMRNQTEWPTSAELADAAAHLSWDRLLLAAPDEKETNGKRNIRLLQQYAEAPSEYAWEVTRAFARAAHVLLGHLHAYANEGYLRTATQWDNVRRLAAMVNYQPRPPASAVATVALIIDPEKGPATVDRGLAMKYAPPVGAPLIYETLEPLAAHPDLNGARGKDWDIDATDLVFANANWIAADNSGLTPGALCALVLDTPAGASLQIAAASVNNAAWSKDAGTAVLNVDPVPGGSWPKHRTYLFAAPDGVLIGLPRSDAAALVLKLDAAAGFPAASLVHVIPASGSDFHAVVLAGEGGYLRLSTTERPIGEVTVERLAPFAATAGAYETPMHVATLYFRRASGSGSAVISSAPSSTRLAAGTSGLPVANVYAVPAGAAGPGYARLADAQTFAAMAVSDPPEIIPGQGSMPAHTARFAGKPPKSLAADTWFVARNRAAPHQLAALRVDGMRKEEGIFYLQFHTGIGSAPDNTEFHGPMKAILRPVDHDRSQQPAVVGGDALIQGLAEAARDVLKPGRAMIVERETAAGREAVHAVLASFELISANPSLTRITLATDADFTGWTRGRTVFRLNATVISHGETKAPKTLGSGNGERARQSFAFKVQGVSFTPSSAAEAGVAPDIDVTVDGAKWDYRDYIDPTADGTPSYSTTHNDDGTLQIHFRRRLPSGASNVSVTRHRVGVGAEGNAAPAFAIAKPMKKHRNVVEVVQPFALAGGAEQESVSSIRVNAPSRLAANGRAVSLLDCERLCRRHASVWRARAKRIIAPGTANVVQITIVPAGGGAITAGLEADLIDFVASKTLPGVRVKIRRYVPLPMRLGATVRVNVARYEKNDVRRQAAAALADAFALQRRDLGAPIFIAQVLTVLERIKGVASSVIGEFAIKRGAAAPERTAQIGGSVAAYFPTPDQVAFVASAEDIVLVMENA